MFINMGPKIKRFEIRLEWKNISGCESEREFPDQVNSFIRIKVAKAYLSKDVTEISPSMIKLARYVKDAICLSIYQHFKYTVLN